MADYQVREAQLDDVQAISAFARSRITAWQRMDAAGHVQDVAYADLTVYERWLHGGPWMSVETGALQLSHLLRGAGLPLVAIVGETVVGYAELYYGKEPAPYHAHIHIGPLLTHADHPTARNALVASATAAAKQRTCQRVTVNLAASDSPNISYYQSQGFDQLDTVRRMTLATQQGQVFYKANAHHHAATNQVDGWHFDIGRLGSARYQWETLWPNTWNAIQQIRHRKTHRLNFQAAGNDAFVLFRQQLYLPRYADVFCWTPKPPTRQLITAICDWAHREGYRKLVLPTIASRVPVLGLNAEADGYNEVIYAKDIP